MEHSRKRNVQYMSKQNWTTEKIYETTMKHVAPLPCQAAYAHNLAGIFSMHIHRSKLLDEGVSPDDLPAPSGIVVAPTGQGKTYLIRKMAELLELNLITIDCSALSREGWKGTTLSEYLAAAKESARDQKAFERSILFLDEIDKRKLWKSEYDQSNSMVNILQLFNNGTITVEIDRRKENIPVGGFTVLFGGAFEGLDDIIRERVCPKQKIGFNTGSTEKLTKSELMQRVNHEDLAKFGIMPELLGRIGTILTIPPLELEDYRQLLNAKSGSLWLKYQNYLNRLYGVTFQIAPSGVEEIAKRCMESPSGARAATPIVNDMMRSAIAAVESEDSICLVTLDANEDGCCIHYGHGERQYAFQDSARENPEFAHWHTVKAKHVDALRRKLCRYYRKAVEVPDVLPQLDAFLDCALTYLYKKCKPTEMTFENLERLARSTHRPNGGTAPFDILLDDARYAVGNEKIGKLDKVYSPWLQQNLTSALQEVAIFLQEYHGSCAIRFEIRKKRFVPTWDKRRDT